MAGRPEAERSGCAPSAARAGALYDAIGRGYARHRVPDPALAAQLRRALGDARSVVDLGAGAGSYEPADRRVVAVELARTMLAQRPAGAAPAVQARAEALPFADGAFDAAQAVLTVHHWSDRDRGLAEARRVATGPVVLLTWLPGAGERFWLHDYFPELLALDEGLFPTLEAFAAVLGPVRAEPARIARDTPEGFLCAHWARPRRYLDAGARLAISSFAKLADPAPGLARLAADLDSGAWQARYGAELALDARDYGYRVVVADGRG